MDIIFDMNTNNVKKFKKILPSLILLAFIALLIGLSFLPSVRGGASVGVSAHTDEIDAEAVRVLNCCRAYAAGNDFTTKLDGTIKAKVFGIPYSQRVHGERNVCGEDFCEVAESVSAFVKAGVKKQCVGGVYSAVRGNYKKKSFVYGNPSEIDRDGYVAAYGAPSVGIVKYELDNSIVRAEKIDDNTFRFVLDVNRATAVTRNEVKTMLGGKSFPDYESVEFTLVADGERAIKVTTREKFRIDKFGGAHCTAEMTEVFSY